MVRTLVNVCIYEFIVIDEVKSFNQLLYNESVLE